MDGEGKLRVVQFGSCDKLLLRLQKVTHSVKHSLPCLLGSLHPVMS